MDNNLSKNKKRFSKEGAIIGAVVGALSASLMGWLGRTLGLSFWPRLLIVIAIAMVFGGILYYFLRRK
jgi:high-affinity Fe2+/Pb2+ permease